ncbi:hypothetical protein L6232_26415, partial [Shewanella sp. C31]|nr:hypothetical protein [Shewanella electrica]
NSIGILLPDAVGLSLPPFEWVLQLERAPRHHARPALLSSLLPFEIGLGIAAAEEEEEEVVGWLFAA